MLGILERGAVQTVCDIRPSAGKQWHGRLSIPGWGTKFTAEYADKEDAVAALVDLRAEAFPSLSPELREQAAPLDQRTARQRLGV